VEAACPRFAHVFVWQRPRDYRRCDSQLMSLCLFGENDCQAVIFAIKNHKSIYDEIGSK